MPKKKIIIIGAGGHAKSCIDILESTKKFNLVGIVEKKKKNKKILSYKIIGNDNDLSKLKRITKNIFIGVGLINNYRERFELINRLNELKFNFIKIISNKANVSINSLIDDGTIVMHKAIIGPNSLIGKNCIINTGAIIEHDTIVGNNSHISTGVIINGSCKIGSNCFIGSGTIIKNGVKIKNNSFIPMGTKITKNVI